MKYTYLLVMFVVAFLAGCAHKKQHALDDPALPPYIRAIAEQPLPAEMFQMIEPGMERSDVEKLLHTPITLPSRDGKSVRYWYRYPRVVVVSPERPLQDDSRAIFIIDYDEDYKVVSKEMKPDGLANKAVESNRLSVP